MFSFCFRHSRFERIAITLQKVYLYCHSNKFSQHAMQISIQWDMIFWEKSQFVDFMTSFIFCSYGSGVVNKSYSKIKFTVGYVVPTLLTLWLFCTFFSWYIHYSQSYGASNTKGWDLEKWVRASLTRQLRKPWFPNSRFQHSWFSASTNPKAPSCNLGKREHMADGECCWMSMFSFVASELWRTAVGNLHSCSRNSFRMT